MIYWAEAYSETWQTSEMELFAKIVNDWKGLILVYSWQGCEYPSAEYKVNCLPMLAIC